MSSSAQNNGPSAAIPRAAVAVTVRSSQHHHKQPDDDDDDDEANGAAKYLLIQRKNPPDAGKWAFPGGKIDLGEEALVAGQRELLEETNLVAADCLWYPHPFMTTDAIHANDNGGFAFHYLIAHCFAQIKPCDTLPLIAASDDALDAKWWTITEIEEQLQTKNSVSNFVLDVIHRAESLYVKDNLVPKMK
eukprot:scaffold22607_cov123-Cylindrotheca_fusiformis.AAC.24